MKIIYCILFFFPLSFCAQSKQDNFNTIDRKVESIPVANTDTLARQLAALGTTDREKVRAIFRWITENIDYNVRPVGRRKNTPPLFYEEWDDSAATLPPLSERVATKILNKGVAFCEGYSHLFKALCDHAGIKAEIIYGYGRTNTSRRFGVNHTWNAVYLDSAWHLLDVTWASGFVSYSNQYIRHYSDFYFLTPPEEFIKDHYPEDPHWTLLDNPPVYREFNQSPFRYSGFIKSGITNYFPVKGVLNVNVGDTVLIELKGKRELRSFFISESPAFDSNQLDTMPPFTIHGEKFVFKYGISATAGEWLYVFCNDELAMKYKLNIKRDAAVHKSSGVLR
ncbi:MAG TPA: transglutaminase domain-containing protein [Chitinophagaceae bacterium]|nr:transglutaminase domain-containing protein [Chitinophagaceae bacterium]